MDALKGRLTLAGMLFPCVLARTAIVNAGTGRVQQGVFCVAHATG